MKKITTQSTKEEEIKQLHDFASSCDSGSYLGSLFTAEFIQWAEERIHNDFPLDIFSELRNTSNSESGAISLLQAKDNILAERSKAFDLKAAEYEEQIKRVETARDMYRTSCEEEVARHFSTVSTLEDTREQVAELQKTIVELKAKLWDLSQNK